MIEKKTFIKGKDYIRSIPRKKLRMILSKHTAVKQILRFFILLREVKISNIQNLGKK